MNILKKIMAVTCALSFVSSSLVAEEIIDRSSEFRSFLADAMREDGFSEAEISYRAIYTPSDFRENILGDQAESSKYSPIDLYKMGKENTPIDTGSLNLSSKKPSILVIFPGIASDVIDAYVFESVLNNESIKVPLDLSSEQKDRVGLTKYYDRKGELMLHVIDLRSPALKMESFLPPKELGQIFKKGIEEAFSLAGFDETEQSVYFLGYSKGVLPALTLIDEASRSDNPPRWYKTKSGKDRLAGLISLSGSLNGSFADSLYEKDELLVKTSEILTEKLDQLDPSIEKFNENYNLIFGKADKLEDSVIIPLLTLLAELESIMPIDSTIKLNLVYGPDGLLQLPNLTDKRVKAESGGRRLDKIIGENILDVVGIASEMTEELIFINAIYAYPDCDDVCKKKYANSINALKSLKHFIPGLIMMQEDRLKDFWSGLDLPNHIKYFSISTTMPEPYKGFEESGDQEYVKAYDSMKTNIDNLVSRLSYYSYVDKLGHKINDGQVSAAHSMLRHDNLSRGSGKSYHIVDLGLVGASHWEVALNPVFKTPESWKKNENEKPYFHACVLRAIARTIVSDQN